MYPFVPPFPIRFWNSLLPSLLESHWSSTCPDLSRYGELRLRVPLHWGKEMRSRESRPSRAGWDSLLPSHYGDGHSAHFFWLAGRAVVVIQWSSSATRKKPRGLAKPEAVARVQRGHHSNGSIAQRPAYCNQAGFSLSLSFLANLTRGSRPQVAKKLGDES